MDHAPETNNSLDDWFETEVLRHEASLTRYLRRAWSNPHDVADLRQEVYVRVYESAARQLPDAPRAFLLTTARNLIFDRIRRERIVSIELTQDFEYPSVLVEGISPEQRVTARQELGRLIWHRRDGITYEEIGVRLGVSLSHRRNTLWMRFYLAGIDLRRRSCRQRQSILRATTDKL